MDIYEALEYYRNVSDFKKRLFCWDHKHNQRLGLKSKKCYKCV